MKRTAAAFLMVAGVAGATGLTGCMTPGPKSDTMYGKADTGRPAMAAAADRGSKGGVMQAGAMMKADGTMVDGNVKQVNGVAHVGGNPQTDGPVERGIGHAFAHGGILPAPGMGPAGAVALVPGAGVGGSAGMFAGGRSSIRFGSPSDMKVTWMDASHSFPDSGRVTPVRYPFVQGSVYRLRLSGIPNRPDKTYYPTLEVYPATAKTVEFLAHTTVPVGFTDEDFEQVKAGNLVVKVIYLPDAAFQDLGAAEEIVSTRLDPGADPVAEANRRGTILAVVRIGNIDLEDPTTPAVDAPAGFGPGPKAGPGMPPPMPMKLGAGGSTGLDVPAVSKTSPANLPPISLPTVK